MDSEQLVLSPLAIIQFVKDSGDQTTNHQLVRHFKDLLRDEENGERQKNAPRQSCHFISSLVVKI